ncbi:unnamed protein product [Phaedon cochleariae]|uniref:Kinesin-like protein n=1 Tax=Phaedon cochleariae TaxID=80249 RepID=A0A9N9X2Y5_PHACE|nr:unnamed protein product [Phaedon cochleariae]
MSYMEIYNEVGYDLLSPKQLNTARYLEELPRISLLEDKKGEAHIRNLSVLPVTTEQEAMRLLFLGDTNRTIAETPMNEYSSRSHCIFTIYLTHRNAGSNKLRYSKLHLVDLAGSERVCKSMSTGLALSEAKHINLSLHFLQQVILALSESRRSHIPYRNSMMTFILKDSLSGNCMTSMLATLAVSKNNILETISTCRFAQRVSMVSTDPVINEIIDPQQEISYLKNKVEELECQLVSATGFKNSSTLTDAQKSQCQYEVKQYLKNASTNQELNILEPDLTQVQFCFGLLKNEVNTQKDKYEELKIKLDYSNTEIEHLKNNILKRDEDIKQLKNSLDKISRKEINPNEYTGFHRLYQTMLNGHAPISTTNRIEERGDLFKVFLSYPKNSETLSFYQTTLEKKLEMARIYAQAIKQCQKNISYIKLQLETSPCYSEKSLLIQELHEQQEIYKKALVELKEIENETHHLQSGLKQEEFKVKHFFNEWMKQNNPQSSIKHNLHSINNTSQSISRNDQFLSSNFSLPVYQNQCPDRPVCSRQTYIHPICCEYPNENIAGTYSCRNQYHEEESCNFPYHMLPEPERNSFFSSSQCCQELQPNNFENLAGYQDTNCMGIISHDHCECSNLEPLKNTTCENTISNYCDEETSKHLLSATEKEVCCGKQPEMNIGDNLSVICQTLPEVDRRNIEAKNTGMAIDIETPCVENEIKDSLEQFFIDTDSKEFKEFMKTVTLTGEPEIDEDIFNFYRTKF